MIHVPSNLDGVSRNHLRFEVDENDRMTVTMLGMNESLLVRRTEEEDGGNKSKKNKAQRLEKGTPFGITEGDIILVDWYRQTEGEKPTCSFKVVKIVDKDGDDPDETMSYGKDAGELNNSMVNRSMVDSPAVPESYVNITSDSSYLNTTSGSANVNATKNSTSFLDASSNTLSPVLDTTGGSSNYLNSTLNTTVNTTLSSRHASDEDFDPEDSSMMEGEESEDSDDEDIFDEDYEDSFNVYGYAKSPAPDKKKRGKKNKIKNSDDDDDDDGDYEQGGGKGKRRKKPKRGKKKSSLEPENGIVMADGTIFHSQEDEEKIRQHKTKLAKQAANARLETAVLNGEIGYECDGDSDEDREDYSMVPITQAEAPASPHPGLSQATTVSKVSGSRGVGTEEEEGEQDEREVNFKVVEDHEVEDKISDKMSDKISDFSKSPMSSSNNLRGLVSPQQQQYVPPSSRLPAKENTFGAALWQHLNSNDPHVAATFVKECTIAHKLAPPFLKAGSMPFMKTLSTGPTHENKQIIDAARVELISSSAASCASNYPAYRYSNGVGVNYLFSDFVNVLQKPRKAKGTVDVAGSMDEALSALDYVAELLAKDVEAGHFDEVEGRFLDALVNSTGGARGMMKRVAKEITEAWGELHPLLDSGLVFGWTLAACLRKMLKILSLCIDVYHGNTGEEDACDIIKENMLMMGKGNACRDSFMLFWEDEGEVKDKLVKRLGKKITNFKG